MGCHATKAATDQGSTIFRESISSRTGDSSFAVPNNQPNERNGRGSVASVETLASVHSFVLDSWDLFYRRHNCDKESFLSGIRERSDHEQIVVLDRSYTYHTMASPRDEDPRIYCLNRASNSFPCYDFKLYEERYDLTAIEEGRLLSRHGVEDGFTGMVGIIDLACYKVGIAPPADSGLVHYSTMEELNGHRRLSQCVRDTANHDAVVFTSLAVDFKRNFVFNLFSNSNCCSEQRNMNGSTRCSTRKVLSLSSAGFALPGQLVHNHEPEPRQFLSGNFVLAHTEQPLPYLNANVCSNDDDEEIGRMDHPIPGMV